MVTRAPRPRQRLQGLAAQLTAVTTPPWDLPPPKLTWKDSLSILTEERDPQTGFIPVRAAISLPYQAEKVLRSGVDEASFRGSLDPSFVPHMVNMMMTSFLHLPKKGPNGEDGPSLAGKGGVHVSDRLTLSRPLQPDELLTMKVLASTTSPHPKGVREQIPITITDAGGKEVVHIDRESLTLTGAGPSAPAPAKAAAPAPPKDPKDGKSFIRAIQFTPDMVGGYCYFSVNKIHNDFELANKMGYKAPIWAGTQGMHITMEHLYKTFGIPKTMTVKFTFARPVHWEDRIELWASSDLQAKAGVGEYVLLNPEGKPAMIMEVDAVTF